MAVCLAVLTGLKAFDTVGEPATLAQRWKTWRSRDDFELYVVASGVSDTTQKRALLLHLAGPQVRNIFYNSIPTEAKGESKDYKKAMDALTTYFGVSGCQETMNNFLARLQDLAEH